MEDYIKYKIPSFNIQFLYPEWWENKIEDKDTYLFWDEFTGSFRISPAKIASPDFSIDQFLKNRFEGYSDKNPEWRIYNNSKYLYYEESSEKDDGITKLHYLTRAAKKRKSEINLKSLIPLLEKNNKFK